MRREGYKGSGIGVGIKVQERDPPLRPNSLSSKAGGEFTEGRESTSHERKGKTQGAGRKGVTVETFSGKVLIKG